jgi:hypothetical protein
MAVSIYQLPIFSTCSNTGKSIYFPSFFCFMVDRLGPDHQRRKGGN